MPGTLHELRSDGVAAVVATCDQMRRRNIRGEIIEDGLEPKKHIIAVRLSDEEFARFLLIREQNMYKSNSSLLRDLLFKKKIVRKEVVVRVTDDYLRSSIERLLYEVNKIGVNYNQIASVYMAQSKMLKPDGTPFMGARLVEEKMIALMQITESLRDEVAVIIDIFKKYNTEQ